MKMVGHQAKGLHLPARFPTGLAQGVEETLPILVILEDGFPPVPAIHHVINRSGIFHSELPRHARKPNRQGIMCQG
jgi:hypothetical protein